MKLYLVVHGFVQGVGYRHLVKRMADKYKINGMVRNLPDGSVEVVAEAEEPSLQSFLSEINVKYLNGPNVMQIETYDEQNEKFPKGVELEEGFTVIND